MVEKKKFFNVEVPVLDSQITIPAYTIAELDKRNIRLDLTRMLRGQNIDAVFRIRVEGEKAVAEPIKLLAPSPFIARMMRNAVNYVEDSFSAECSDGQFRIKPFLITRKKVHRRVRKALRNETKRYIKEYVKDKSIDEVFLDAINAKIQRPLSLKLKKIYPLAFCEIRQLIVEKEKERATIERIKTEEAKPEIQVEEKTEEIEQIEEKAKEEKQEVKEEEAEGEVQMEKSEITEEKVSEKETEEKEEKPKKPRKKKEK